jgi:hypothetical protein
MPAATATPIPNVLDHLTVVEHLNVNVTNVDNMVDVGINNNEALAYVSENLSCRKRVQLGSCQFYRHGGDDLSLCSPLELRCITPTSSFSAAASRDICRTIAQTHRSKKDMWARNFCDGCRMPIPAEFDFRLWNPQNVELGARDQSFIEHARYRLLVHCGCRASRAIRSCGR